MGGEGTAHGQVQDEENGKDGNFHRDGEILVRSVEREFRTGLDVRGMGECLRIRDNKKLSLLCRVSVGVSYSSTSGYLLTCGIMGRVPPHLVVSGFHFIKGNAMTSLMLGLSVRSITRRSIPIPMPPVGGIPVSTAIKKSSSTLMS